MSGDENDSADAARFMAAARELARVCGCPILVIHHSSKSGDQSEARSSRGSGEIIGAPDVLINVDASGKYPTAHFLCRNHESPGPVGYRFSVVDDALRCEVLPPCAGKSKGIGPDEVLRVFEEHPNDGLTLSKVRELIAAAKGKSKGSKESEATVKKHVDALVAQGALSACEIKRPFGRPMPGWRLGSKGGVVSTAKISAGANGSDDVVGGADGV